MSVGPHRDPRTNVQRGNTLFRTLRNFLHLDRVEAAKETRSWILGSLSSARVLSTNQTPTPPDARNVFVATTGQYTRKTNTEVR